MIAHGTRIEGSPSGIPHTALRHTQRRPVSDRESGPEEAVPCGNWRDCRKCVCKMLPKSAVRKGFWGLPDVLLEL